MNGSARSRVRKNERPRWPRKHTAMLIAAILLALVLTALVITGSGWSNVLSTRRNEIVFDGRHQAYGAFVLRREYHRTMLLATASATVLVGGLLTAPKLFPSDPEVREGPWMTPSDTVIWEVGPAEPDPPQREQKHHQSASTDATDLTALVPKDTMPEEPKDTTSTSIGPKGPDPGPDTLALKGPGGKGGGGERPDTTTFKAWEATAPEYPGGMEALYQDLNDIIRYPQIDIDAGREGRVYMSFVVTADGRIDRVSVGRGVSPTLDAEAIRALKQLRKRWKPGRSPMGKDVSTYFSIPIHFHLKGN